MTVFLWAASIFVAAVWATVITYLYRTRDRKPPSVPGRDAPERPAATGPPGSDPRWLKGGPGIPAGGSAVPAGTPQAPRPGRLPEGDTQLLWPPQEAPGPGDLLARAKAAIDGVKGIPLDGYLDHVGAATAYGDDGPFINWLSHETQARGIPAIKDEVK